MGKGARATQEQLNRMLKNIEAGKKEVPESTDLFGETVPTSVMEEFKRIFNAIKINPKKVIWIPSNVIGKKNNYIIHRIGKAKSACCSVLVPRGQTFCPECGNETTKVYPQRVGLNNKADGYLKGTIGDYAKNYKRAKSLIDPKAPIIVAGAFFVRTSNQRFDYDNMKTMVCDQLVKSGILEDDAANKFMLLPLGYIVDKKRPGVVIKFFDHKNYFNYIIHECNKDK